MIDPLRTAASVAAAGLEAQSARMRVVSENIANAQSTGTTPGADPYRRRTISFAAEMDRLSGAAFVRVDAVGSDSSPFELVADPGNPAADASGMVKMPNVNMLIEMTDMREAARSYEANLQVIKQARAMTAMTIDLLRNG